MSRIKPLTVESANGKSRELLEGVKKSMGGVPNLLGTMAQSPAALQAYLSLSQALSGASLPAPVREQIALTVAGANGCEYCAAAHTFLARKAGVSDGDLQRALRAEASDAKTDAILTLARRIVDTRGFVDDGDIDAARRAGVTDGEIAEIVATVALNVYTNYFNHVAETEVDFPKVALPAGA